MSKSPTHVPDFGLEPSAYLSGVEIKVAGKDPNKTLVYVYTNQHEEKFLVGKKAVMCITGRVLGNHTKSLVGNKHHSFEYNGKTISVEEGKEAYSITLIDVDDNRDDKELVDMFESGFFGMQLDDLKEVFDDLIEKTYKSKQCFAGFKKKFKIKSRKAFEETVNYVGFADKEYGQQQKFECPVWFKDREDPFYLYEVDRNGNGLTQLEQEFISNGSIVTVPFTISFYCSMETGKSFIRCTLRKAALIVYNKPIVVSKARVPTMAKRFGKVTLKSDKNSGTESYEAYVNDDDDQ